MGACARAVVTASLLGAQGWRAGTVLSADQIAALSPERLEELLAAGALRPVPGA
jgi:hypothetical protein